MRQATCPACGHHRDGMMVTFQSNQQQAAIVATLNSGLRNEWRPHTERSLWFSVRGLYGCLPYWQEFYDFRAWTIQRAALTPEGQFHLGPAMSWEAIEAEIPTLFVGDIVQSGRIRVMMQPVVDVVAARVVGYEMLARGVREDGGFIPPNVLFGAAREQSQLFLLDKACRIAAIEAGARLPADKLIFVNFIPTSIYVPEHCLTTTLAAVRRVGIDSGRIVFEVVETDRVDDLSHLRQILAYYRSTGFHCALDDYGEGFSDEETLTALAPDIVKLDRQYVTDIDRDAKRRTRAEAVYQEGLAMGARMLAEGIEREEEAIALARIGYHWQQGYWYGRPGWDPADVDPEKIRRVQAAAGLR